MRNPSASWGFTLVEVLVALAIGGLVTLTAAATAAAIPDVAGRADAQLAGALRSVAVRTQLREWLRASYASRDSTYDAAFTGVDGPRSGTDALRFPLVDPTATVRGRASIVLAIDGNPDGSSSLVAEIQPESGSRTRIELVPGAGFLEARYLYFVSSEPRWFTGWGSEVERPSAVRLWIDGEDLDPLLRMPLTVWLRS
jgi:prepilin-type N-terminal cleavage/methylation domain-containing protein